MPGLVPLALRCRFGFDGHLLRGQPAAVAGHSRDKLASKIIAGFVLPPDRIPLLRHSFEQQSDAREAVETRSASDAVVTGRVVVEDDGDAFVGVRFPAKFSPPERHVGQFGRTLFDGHDFQYLAAGHGIDAAMLPGRKGHRHESAVEFGLRGIVGDFHDAKPLYALLPLLPALKRIESLEKGNVETRQDARVIR